MTRSFKIKNQYYINECDNIIKRYRFITDKLGERSQLTTIDKIVEAIKNGPNDDRINLDIVSYGMNVTRRMRDCGHEGNASNYENTLNNLKKFVGRESIGVQEITTKFVKDWINYLTNMPARQNRERGTRAQSQYPSNLRALVNMAKAEYNDEDSGIIRIPLSPFSKVKIPKVGLTRKRALTISQIQDISKLPYIVVNRCGFMRANLAKDLFILSFGLIGMNAVDLYNCDKYKDGRLIYQRTKTRNRRADRAEISIKVLPEIEKLIEKYKDPTGEKVFCFHLEYSSCSSFEVAINRGLKTIGEKLGIEDLEFYAARHSWATIASNDADIDKYVVHSALNHVDPTMRITDIYIKKNWDQQDRANRKVMDLVNVDIDIKEPCRDKYIIPNLNKAERQTKSK